MGEAFAGRTVGRKAVLWGILAQSIPDIDFIVSSWMDTPSALLAHRGFTHSILFAVTITVLMALLSNRLHRPHNISFTRWFFFFAAAILSHIFLDTFNNYGVGLLEPFQHSRISFNTIYVADPFFSIAPGIALVMLFVLKQKNNKRKYWWKFGLGLSGLYLCYCVINKYIIDRDVKKQFALENISYSRYFTTPAPLQNWLWFVVAGNDSGYYTGYRSIFDRTNKMHFQYFARNAALLNTVPDKKEVQQLISFSQQFYTVEKREDTLVFNDLRFGQVIGWQNPKEEFAFHYYLQPGIDNRLVVQRGRFAKWDREAMETFFRRIKGE
jgi:inner membrane protein